MYHRIKPTALPGLPRWLRLGFQWWRLRDTSEHGEASTTAADKRPHRRDPWRIASPIIVPEVPSLHFPHFLPSPNLTSFHVATVSFFFPHLHLPRSAGATSYLHTAPALRGPALQRDCTTVVPRGGGVLWRDSKIDDRKNALDFDSPSVANRIVPREDAPRMPTAVSAATWPPLHRPDPHRQRAHRR